MSIVPKLIRNWQSIITGTTARYLGVFLIGVISTMSVSFSTRDLTYAECECMNVIARDMTLEFERKILSAYIYQMKDPKGIDRVMAIREIIYDNSQAQALLDIRCEPHAKKSLEIKHK